MGVAFWLFWGCRMNNSGVGQTSLPLTLRWVEGLWECWVEGHALPEPDPQRAVRKLCQQHSRPESLGLPHPSGALRIDQEPFPEAVWSTGKGKQNPAPVGHLQQVRALPVASSSPSPPSFWSPLHESQCPIFVSPVASCRPAAIFLFPLPGLPSLLFGAQPLSPGCCAPRFPCLEGTFSSAPCRHHFKGPKGRGLRRQQLTFLCFTDEETETQQGQVTCSG